ncbi:MAG: endonuclease/exonuclease/phosphatase family protein, partial [Candidatus Heimdallarchaeota archaeon]
MDTNPTEIKETAYSLLPSAFGGCLVFIFLSQIERFLTMIFVLNFSTAGPNITVIMILFLVTGLLELVIPWPHSDRLLSLFMILTFVLILVGFYPDTLIASIGSLGALLAVTPLIVHEINVEKQRFVFSVGFGLFFQLLIRSWLDGATYYSTLLGSILLLVWGILPIIIWFGYVKSANRANPPSADNLIDAVPVITFLMIQYLFLGSPSVVSTWHIRDYPLISLAGSLGVFFGLFVVLYGSKFDMEKRTVSWIIDPIILYLVSIIDLIWLDVFSIVSYFIAQATSIVILFLGLNYAVSRTLVSIRRVGIRMGLIQLITILIIFLEVSAGNWAFMPSALAWTRGLANWFVFILALVFPLSCFEFKVPRVEFIKQKSFSKGAQILAVILLLTTISGVVVNSFLAISQSPSTSSLKVMTYNIHQYYATGQSGEFNLEQVRDVIRASGADIVGLQESEGGRITSSNMNGVRWLAHQLGMQYYFYGPPTSAQIYGVSLLSRYPIISQRWIYLPREVSIERVAIMVVVETGSLAGQVPIIVTHFQTSPFADDRFLQAQAIFAETFSIQNAIIMGDFNTPPNGTDPTYLFLNNSFSDAWVL